MIKARIEKLSLSFRQLDRRSKWIVFLCFALFVFLVRALVIRFTVQGDTGELIRGTNQFYKCWIEQKVFNCTHADQFPILQRLIILPSMILTKDPHVIGRILSLFSFMSFCGLIGLAAYNFLGRASVFLTFLLILITSPFLYYSRVTFGEMLSTFCLCLFTFACMRHRSKWFLFVSFVLAAFSKEVAFPFLVLIFFSTFYSWGKYSSFFDFWNEFKREKLAFASIVAASVFSVALAILQNFSRFDTYYNVSYMVETYKFSSFKTFLSFFFGLWFAPNSGILFFWNSAFIVFFIVFALFVKNFRRNFYFYIPAVGALLLNFVSTVGLAKWWAPFGWIAWGPRLSLPFLAVGVLIVLHFYGEQIIEKLRELRKIRYILFVVFFVLSISQFAVLKNSEIYASLITEPSPPECPKLAIIEESKEYYYMCMDMRMWKPKHFVPWEVIVRDMDIQKGIGISLYAVLIWLMTSQLFARVVRPRANR